MKDWNATTDGSHSPKPPSRRLTPYYGRDEMGFLDPARHGEIYTHQDIIKLKATVIKAQPWMGKTTFATELFAWLSSPRHSKNHFGAQVYLARLNESLSREELLPPWWDAWKSDPLARPACWIVDGLDECEQTEIGMWRRITRAIRELSLDKHRQSLRLILLSRDRDWLTELENDLRVLYPSSDSPLVVRLAPMDRQEASDMIGEPQLKKVIETIRRFNLEAIAGYPRVLKYLSGLEPNAKATEFLVWKGILTDLLYEHNNEKRKNYKSEIEERFDATSRIAAILSISAQNEINELSRNSTHLNIADFFPLGMSNRAKLLRQAANDSLLIGGPFRGTLDGGYRFAHRNIRDWFCAFGLCDFPLTRLRSAVLEGSTLREDLIDMLQLLKKMSADEHVKKWLTQLLSPFGLQSHDGPWGLEDTLQKLDELEGIATKSPSSLNIYDDDRFRRLEAPGLGSHVAARLVDSSRSETARKLLIDLALALRLRECVNSALTIVLDSRQSIELKIWAAVLVRKLGTPDSARALAPSIATVRGKSRRERDLQAQAILALLQHGVWTVAVAAQYAPPEHPNMASSSTLLHYEMEKMLTIVDARLILHFHFQTERKTLLPKSHYRSQQTRRNLIFDSVGLLTEEENLTTDDYDLLERAIFRYCHKNGFHPLNIPIQNRLRESRTHRRRIYKKLIRGTQKNITLLPIFLRYTLTEKDAKWLLRNTATRWNQVAFAWQDLYRLSKEWPETLTDQLRADILSAIRSQASDVASQYDRAKQEESEAEARVKRSLESRKAMARIPLSNAVEETLTRTNVDDAERMRLLSLLCFSSQVYQYRNIYGEWSVLDLSQQEKVLTACRAGLIHGTPSSFPEEHNSFSTVNYAEAKAFSSVLHNSTSRDWVDGDLIRKWLPGVIRTLSSDSIDTVAICATCSRQSTIQAIAFETARELSGRDVHFRFANFIPNGLWPGTIAELASNFINNSENPLALRARLLELLAEREPEFAKQLAERWTPNQWHGDDRDILGWTALNIRLILAPDEAWQFFEQAYRTKGIAALQAMKFLWGHRMPGAIALEEWPTAPLERLCNIIMAHFPYSDDQSIPKSGRVTAETELPLLRDRGILILLERHVNGDKTAGALICEASPIIKIMLETRLRQREAIQLLAGLPQQLEDSVKAGALSVSETIRLLDDADYRLIRSDDDLTNAIMFALNEIGNDVAFDLSMLFGREHVASPATSDSVSMKKATKSRKRLDEDALQAYIRRRLIDLLPARIPNIRFTIFREAQGKYRRRFDLEIVAPTQSGQLAHLVIEIKWSDNKETETSLIEQLGKKYLIHHGIKQGKYLVGWVGSWKHNGRTNTSMQQLQEHLSNQCQLFTSSGDGKSLRIESVVLDLQWTASLALEDEE